MNVFLAAIAAGKVTRADIQAFLDDLRRPRHHQADQVGRQGRGDGQDDLRLRGEGRRHHGHLGHQVSDARRPARSEPMRVRAAGALRGSRPSSYRGTRRQGQLQDWLIYDQFWDLTVSGLALGSIYAPRGPRLHAGLRRAAPHQLRPLRDLHARHLRHRVRRRVARHRPGQSGQVRARAGRRPGAVRAGRRWPSRAARPSPSSGWPTGRSAGATRPRLVALISAIGMSVAISEFCGQHVNRAATTSALPDVVASTRVFTFFDATITQQARSSSSHRPSSSMVIARPVRAPAPASAAASEPWPRTPRPPR